MGKYFKLFNTHSQYEAFTGTTDFILPNVSFCKDTPTEVHYNPYIPPETRVVAKFNVTDTSSPTKIANKISGFSSIEIDGIEQPSVTTGYTFSTTGEHNVKYTLTDSTTIGRDAFYWCDKLTSIDIPSGVTSIGYGAFQECRGLTSINIPNSVTSIGILVFQNCRSLTSIDIPNSVMSIGNIAFQNCYSLTSIDIPNSVTSIGNETFYGCSGLTSIASNATTAPTIQSNTFQNVKTNGTLYVPIGSTGYDVWMGTGDYYLGKYNWTKVEQ